MNDVCGLSAIVRSRSARLSLLLVGAIMTPDQVGWVHLLLSGLPCADLRSVRAFEAAWNVAWNEAIADQEAFEAFWAEREEA